MDIYQRLKVKKYINAWDAVSAYGSSRMEKETLDAMRDAASAYVHIEDLREAVGREIAHMTGNEAAFAHRQRRVHGAAPRARTVCQTAGQHGAAQ